MVNDEWMHEWVHEWMKEWMKDERWKAWDEMRWDEMWCDVMWCDEMRWGWDDDKMRMRWNEWLNERMFEKMINDTW